jgi:hypothetical protein
MDASQILDDATADLFTLDPLSEPADDLAGYGDSADCTSNGCTKSCQVC